MPQSDPPRRRITKKGMTPKKLVVPPFLHVFSVTISTTTDYDNCPQRPSHTLSGVALGLVTIHDEPNAEYENRHIHLRLSFDVEAFGKFNIRFRMFLFFHCNIPE
jgi:hypothetical protein